MKTAEEFFEEWVIKENINRYTLSYSLTKKAFLAGYKHGQNMEQK